MLHVNANTKKQYSPFLDDQWGSLLSKVWHYLRYHHQLSPMMIRIHGYCHNVMTYPFRFLNVEKKIRQWAKLRLQKISFLMCLKSSWLVSDCLPGLSLRQNILGFWSWTQMPNLLEQRLVYIQFSMWCQGRIQIFTCDKTFVCVGWSTVVEVRGQCNEELIWAEAHFCIKSSLIVEDH